MSQDSRENFRSALVRGGGGGGVERWGARGREGKKDRKGMLRAR